MNHIIDDDFLYTHMGKAENYLMASIPDEAEIDYEFSKRFQRKIKGLLKYERRSPAMRSFVKFTKSVAAVFLVVISIAFTTTMSVEAYRIRFFEFVTTVWEEVTSIFVSSDHGIEDALLVPSEPSFIPEGYTESERNNSAHRSTIIYTNGVGKEVLYIQQLLTQGEFLFDTAGTDIKEIQVENQPVHIFANKGMTQLYWNDNIYIYVINGNVDENELISMAQTIIKKK